MLDLAAGDSLDAVAERYKAPKPTVQGWAKVVKKRMGNAPAIIRENAFDVAVQDAAIAFMRSIKAHSELAEDRTWLLNMTAKEGGVDDVLKFTDSIGKRLVYIVGFTSGQPAPQREAADDSARAIEAELIE